MDTFVTVKELFYTDLTERVARIGSAATFEELYDAMYASVDVVPKHFRAVLDDVVNLEREMASKRTKLKLLKDSLLKMIDESKKESS